jgi:lipoprotein-releasing system ATP-binding protein
MSASTSGVVLRTSHVNKYFHEPETFQVLKNINLSVHAGEFLTIMGKSGCGKSTLLYLLSTMDTDYEGDIELNGHSLKGKTQNQLAAIRNENIGFVFQFHYLLPEFTALENVMIPAMKLGRYSHKEIEEKAYQKLRILDVHSQAQKTANKLSGGQQQRVAIARALINDPLIIMGDEPTGNLDTSNSRIVFNIFKELTREFRQTIITVTHDPDFAANSDRIIEMSDGEIIRQ